MDEGCKNADLDGETTCEILQLRKLLHVYACFHNFRNFLWGEEEDFLRNVKVLYTRKQRIGKFEIAGRAIEDNSTIRYFINQIFGIGNSYES